ncbi:hypothetical protein C8Q77DRAFT_1152904 [Trametes polyzona]|nr:hypothetical protein C8Q77DRAFT_1152904 [Trametes polyzona]
MAFAQFYYDPALEFEKLLDDDVPAPVVPANAHSNKASGGGGDTSAAVKGPASAAGPGGAMSASMGAEPQPGQDCSGHAWSPSRWFSEGLLRRRASTGSINGGPHPGIPK